MLLRDAIERFIFTKKAIGRSKDTITYYSRNLNLFYQYFGNRNIKEIQDHTFMKYQKWLLETYSVKRISIQTYSRATKALLRWLQRENFINININKLELVKAEQIAIFPLLDVEIQKVLAEFTDASELSLRNKIIFLLLIDCGLRRGEIPKIKKSDMYLENETLCVHGKGSKERYVRLGQLTITLIQKYMQMTRHSSEYLLIKKDGTAITGNTIKMIFQRLRQKTGIDRLYPHMLRHTFATNYLLDTGNLEALRIIMGHSTVAMTQKYVHIAAQMQIINGRHLSHIDFMLKNS